MLFDDFLCADHEYNASPVCTCSCWPQWVQPPLAWWAGLGNRCFTSCWPHPPASLQLFVQRLWQHFFCEFWNFLGTSLIVVRNFSWFWTYAGIEVCFFLNCALLLILVTVFHEARCPWCPQSRGTLQLNHRSKYPGDRGRLQCSGIFTYLLASLKSCGHHSVSLS